MIDSNHPTSINQGRRCCHMATCNDHAAFQSEPQVIYTCMRLCAAVEELAKAPKKADTKVVFLPSLVFKGAVKIEYTTLFNLID